MESRHEPLIDG